MSVFVYIFRNRRVILNQNKKPRQVAPARLNLYLSGNYSPATAWKLIEPTFALVMVTSVQLGVKV